eukprot:gene4977-6960_t
MEINDQSLGLLQDLLLNILSPDNNTRKKAEEYVKSIETQQGFPLLVVGLISRLISHSDAQSAAVRQSAAVLFKNLVKRRWEPTDGSEEKVSQGDKDAIKLYVVDLMCSAQPDVQKLLAEAVTVIAKHDFPAQWEVLLPQLVSKLSAQDIRITKGVMLTANSIMKRFRYVFKNDNLYQEILFCLEGFKIPLMEQYKANEVLIINNVNNRVELFELLETQRLMSRIYFSLNWQDIPEYFEDNIATWMTEFSKYMVYTNPLLVDDNDEAEPGPIEKLQAAIIDNLNLYATKYEDIFEPYLPNFTQLIWKMLIEVQPQVKYDILATSAIKFLTSVSGKQMNTSLFSDAALQDIIQHIVIKNLTATENDEELFEDNPTDYIRKDMEGSDVDTRRRCAIDLVRSLLKFFNTQVSQLCLTFTGAMLEQYNASKDWRAKDSALHLILAVSVLSTSTANGAGALNPNINIFNIFETNVVPELQDMQVNNRPIVKADAIKLMCIFRSHLPSSFLIGLIPHITRHLHSKHVVIQTYAAMCIEKFLSLKDRDPNQSNVSIPRITKESLLPHFESMFVGLFAVLENPDLPENDYVMKCIMRMLLVIGSDISPATELVLKHLMTSLERVCKNPVNPHFDHYLFESLAILIKSCTSGQNIALEVATASCVKFESLLFPTFQNVLAQDVVEFIPYVFQILAQLLSARVGEGLSSSYSALFPLLLSPALWERKGNIPALTDLFTAYLSKGMAEIVAGNYLQGVLGVFQKLLASKASESYAFILLNAIYCYTPTAVISPFVQTIFNLLLMRMQEAVKDSKTVRYCKYFVNSICVFAAQNGGQIVRDTLETITPGLVSMIVLNIWSVNRSQLASSDSAEVKQMIVGATRLLIESNSLSNEVWISLLQSILSLIEAEGNNSKGSIAHILDEVIDLDEDENRDFDNAYSKLAHAGITYADPTSNIPSGGAYFATSLSSFCAARPGQYISLIQANLAPNEKEILQTILQSNGVGIV